MAFKQSNPTSEDVRVVYNAIVDYHNNLVQIRFTTAGLFLAANGFLAIGFFQQSNITAWFNFVIPALGILMTVGCVLLEKRNRQLLANLGMRGQYLETSLGLDKSQRFFSLMEYQPIGPNLQKNQSKKPGRSLKIHLVTHTFGICLLYGLVLLFWLVILVIALFHLK
jgi:hypothetical protein